MRFTTLTFLILAGVSMLAVPDHWAQAAAFKCWTNKDGVKECGNAVPPEYAQQGHTAYSSDGMTVGKQQAAKSAEEYADEQKHAQEQAAKERQAKVQADSDRVLLQTFSSADDVMLARDGRVSTVEGQIKLAEGRLQKNNQSLQQLVKSAADLERGGKPVPEKLTNDIETVRKQIAEGETFISQKRQEIEEIRQKFDADLHRWKELQAKR